MPIRSLLTALVAGLCFAAAPAGPSISIEPFIAGGTELPTTDTLPTNDGFASLLRADPLRAFEKSLQRYRDEIRGYTCTMEKQERIGGVLRPKEIVSVAFREEPFSVFMKWQGVPEYRLPYCSLYVRGENDGKTKALVRTRLGAILLDTRTNSAESRNTSRYSIEDFGFYNNTLRTHRAWSEVRSKGRFHYEFLRTEAVAECGDRICHVIRRHCDPPEVDTFSLSETEARDPAQYPTEAFTTVTLMFDAETWLQVGSVQTDANGELVGAYYFRDVVLNPTFTPEQFTLAALQK
jgi:hypothetical protein